MVKLVYADQNRLSSQAAVEKLWLWRVGFISWLLYNLLWLPARLIFILLFGLEIKSQAKLDQLRGPLIIVANHGCWLDPFWIGAAFPFLSKVYPIRYGTWYRFFYMPLFLPFLLLIGSFPIRKKIGLERSLAVALTILRRGGVVGIFPEGKRRSVGEKAQKGRRGAAYLAAKTNTPILPVKIRGNIGVTILGSFFGQHKISIHFGKPFYLTETNPDNLNDLTQAANLIMQKVREI